jgi:hypothetical protein
MFRCCYVGLITEIRTENQLIAQVLLQELGLLLPKIKIDVIYVVTAMIASSLNFGQRTS